MKLPDRSIARSMLVVVGFAIIRPQNQTGSLVCSSPRLCNRQYWRTTNVRG